MSNADVLLRQDDETVDVPQTSQYQDSRPVIGGHKSQENAFARVRAERPALLVTLVGRGRRDSARKHGKRGSHHRERPASKCERRHRIASPPRSFSGYRIGEDQSGRIGAIYNLPAVAEATWISRSHASMHFRFAPKADIVSKASAPGASCQSGNEPALLPRPVSKPAC